MKPFLILQLRPDDQASDNEFDAILKYGGLEQDEVHRVRMEKEGIPSINLAAYSGIVLSGGPSNVSDAIDNKPPYQIQFETDLNKLLTKIFETDFPIMGICYGIGSLVAYKGGIVSTENYSEAVGAVEIKLTATGLEDELLQGIAPKFMAYVGHKEACQTLPEDATLLAGSENCPFQMIRFRNNIYATQFHTELDNEGIALRIKIYKNHGYFSADEADELIQNSKTWEVNVPKVILRNFVKRYQEK
ncbi:MAG: glutamine amidotransferase [Flavobacteriaceae bacterium]|nr:glutamine amidotransferase [Flavobacteriaceae bacterium]